MACGFVCVVLFCFSWVLPLLRVLYWSAKASVMSRVPQPVQKAPLNCTTSKGGVNATSLAVALGLWVRL